jgi:hypothetical protein
MNFSPQSRFFVFALILFLGMPAISVNGQDEDPEKEAPAAEDVMLTTRDKVDLRCTYFAPVYEEEEKVEEKAEGAETPAAVLPGKSAKETPGQGKTTLPFILLHDLNGKRGDLFVLAKHLQSAGCAVIVPDLRGHGDSVTMAAGMQKLDLAKFKKADYANIVWDIEACKRFLVQKNNQGELNIDLLNVLAIGQTSTAAMEWIIADWFKYPPYKGSIKQGQDVKSLILVSPSKKMQQININAVLKHAMFAGRNPQIPNLPTLVVWSDDGSESADIKDCSSIFETMKKGRPDLSKIKDEEERGEKETVFQIVIPRSRDVGADLLDQNQELRNTILEFVAIKVGSFREEHPWQDRRKKE